MKTLYLLRHAEAAPDKGGGDFERNLTHNGTLDAAALGRVMASKNYRPALALCSSAKRTQQTLGGVLESIDIGAVRYDKAIYHATTQDLLSIIHGIDDKYTSALIVGHNPVIHEMAAMLARDEKPDLSSQLARGYPPGTLSVLSCPRGAWRDLQRGENRLDDLLSAAHQIC